MDWAMAITPSKQEAAVSANILWVVFHQLAAFQHPSYFAGAYHPVLP